MRTREEFIRLWRYRLAGMALFGVASEVKDGPISRAAKVYDIPGEVEAMLSQMWESLQERPEAKNGTDAAKRESAQTQQGVRK